MKRRKQRLWCCVCGRIVTVLGNKGRRILTSCAPMEGGFPGDFRTLAAHRQKVRAYRKAQP
jgi:hypothetical protein